MLNIFAKFWPRQCDVAPWTPLPVSGMNAYRSTTQFKCSVDNFVHCSDVNKLTSGKEALLPELLSKQHW